MENKDFLKEIAKTILVSSDRENILKAMYKIDRKYFVKDKGLAYLNQPFDIGNNQTISQPSTVARMLQELELKKGDNVLEVGTGSGWNAALIAYLVNPGRVWSFEIYKDLVNFAKKNVKRFNLENLEIRRGDFREFEKDLDKIIFTAGVGKGKEQKVLDFAQSNLKEKGILVCPHQRGPLIIARKIDGKIKQSYSFDEFVFVPLVL